MDKHFHQFISQIDKDIKGIIWLTSGPIKSHLPYFSELNYLFDGLISHSLKEFPNNQTGIFFTNNFNEKFFLIHFDYQNGFDQINEKLNQILISKESKIAIIHSSPVLEKMILKDFPSIQLKTFD